MVGRACVNFKAMERSRSSLEDFCRSYFMFHGMDANKSEDVFKYLPVLAFVEAYIYQLDELNEEGLLSDTQERPVSELDPFSALRRELIERGLLSERIENELSGGIEYWELERSLCRAISNDGEILVPDVMRAMHLKSFDYRVLNLLLYQLRGQKVNEVHYSFLMESEVLVEISDDLYDYEEDVIKNSFNILRMFVKAYGASKAPAMLAKCISEKEEKYQRLIATLEPDLAIRYMKRCEEAVKEGGSKSNYVMGSWVVPHLIVNENAYRSQVEKCGEDG